MKPKLSCSILPSQGGCAQTTTALFIIFVAAQSAQTQQVSESEINSNNIDSPRDSEIITSNPIEDLLHDTLQREDGFKSALKDVFPMTPEMVREYREAIRKNEEAIYQNPYPETIDDAALVALEPGGNPIELNVVPGMATAVGFHDVTGKPWPIRSYVIGNSEIFQVVQLGEQSSVLAVSPLTRVGWTNLVVALAGEESPVVVKVIINLQRVHVRRSIQVMKLGPNSQSDSLASSPNNLPVAGDKELLSALSGIGLGGDAKKIEVSGVNAEAWVSNGQLYIRSKHSLLSPPWTGSISGPSGIRAYRLGINSALLFSVDGRIVQAILALP